MSAAAVITRWNVDGETETWTPSTLDSLGKNEEFFEGVLAGSIDLLGLGSRRSGIRGPYRVFRQAVLPTPSGRTVYPDIVVLSASGHVIVVEVKRSVNPELRDRAVIAQIIDYASSFAALTDDELLRVFGAQSNVDTWGGLIAEYFPDEADQDELANVLASRLADGELNLVIACDKIPPGLPDIVRGVTQQRSLGFDLDLVEVVPFARDSTSDSDILFVPSTRLTTEIVGRTAVTVHYQQGDAQPTTSVKTTSLDEIVVGLRDVKVARAWNPAEVDSAFTEEGNPVALELLSFAKQHGHRGQYVSDGQKQNAAFGYYVPVTRQDGSFGVRMAFVCMLGDPRVWIYFNRLSRNLPSEMYESFKAKLKQVFGDNIDTTMGDAGVALGSVQRHMAGFKEVMLWLTSEATGQVDSAS